MIDSKAFFKNRTAVQAFAVLLVGVIVFVIAGIFLFMQYFTYRIRQPAPGDVAWQFVRTVRLGHALPAGELRSYLHAIRGRHIRVFLSFQSAPNSYIITTNNPRELYKWALANYPKILASLSLDNGRWLIIRSVIRQRPWYAVGLVSMSILLLILLIFLIYMVVSKITMPIDRFVKATKRFGVDVQAPPMAVEGPPEVQELSQAFNEMQARIRRLIHDRTQMLAAISHDLRTPITRLQLRAEYLKDTDQYEKAVADLNEMEKMISSILSFARDYASAEAMEKFDLNALLESLCDDLIDTGFKVHYEGVEQRIPMLGRITALKRAFTNLIENAIKYGKSADVKLIVKESEVQVRVQDQGPGIPEAEMEKVFSPFYRVDAARSPETSGSGLGLAVSRDIIRTHGGEIKLQNLQPQGLLAVVTLPLK